MQNLLAVNENFTNNYSSNLLDFLSLDAILCGILVIVSKNPIVSVLFLIGLFLSISCYLILLGLNFIGLSYLLVYVGAVSILFLFILMLINIRISELLNDTSNSIFLAIFISIAFNYIIDKVLPYGIATINWDFNIFTVPLDSINNTLRNFNYYFFNIGSNQLAYFADNTTNNNIFFVTSKVWDGNLAEVSHITSIGNIMYTSYSIWLILTSIILLLAMVGSIVITIKNEK